MSLRLNRRRDRYGPYIRSAARGLSYARKGYNMYKMLTGKSKLPPKKRYTRNKSRSVASKSKPSLLYRSTATRMGRFPKPVRNRPESSYAKYGSVKKVEHGGIWNDPECVFVGHATYAHEQVIPGVCRALIRELMKQWGQDFVAWEETIKTGALEVQLSYRYYLGPTDTTLTQRSIAITAAMTMVALSDALYSDWNTAFGTDTHYIEDIWINEVAGANQTHALIRGRQFELDMYVESKMSIQNRTLAGTGIGENDQEMTDISNNPLKGRLYEGKYCGFIPDHRNNNELNYTGYTANPQSGLILARASESLIGQTKKPPPSWFFHNCKKSGSVVLAPGVIRTNTITRRAKMSLNAFMGKFARQIGLAQNTNMVNYVGNSAMFGFEKSLDSRQSEADISVAYEINQKYCIAGYYRKGTATIPLLEVN